MKPSDKKASIPQQRGVRAKAGSARSASAETAHRSQRASVPTPRKRQLAATSPVAAKPLGSRRAPAAAAAAGGLRLLWVVLFALAAIDTALLLVVLLR